MRWTSTSRCLRRRGSAGVARGAERPRLGQFRTRRTIGALTDLQQTAEVFPRPRVVSREPRRLAGTVLGPEAAGFLDERRLERLERPRPLDQPPQHISEQRNPPASPAAPCAAGSPGGLVGRLLVAQAAGRYRERVAAAPFREREPRRGA